MARLAGLDERWLVVDLASGNDGFDQGKNGGCSCALRVAFKCDYLLDRLVWHIWFRDIGGMK